MPNATPARSSPPPRGTVDPEQLFPAEILKSSRTFQEKASDPRFPERQRVPDLAEVLEVNHSPDELNTSDEKTCGDDQQGCNQQRNRKKAIKEISTSSTAFIGPACRPQPGFENELSEFYKELEQFDHPDTVHRNKSAVSLSWASPNHVDRKSKNVSQSWASSDTTHGNSHFIAHFTPPPSNAPFIKENWNDHRNTYRPYPAGQLQTGYSNSPQRRPQPYDMNCAWSNPNTFQNHWQHSQPDIHFYPSPRPVNRMPYPPYPPYFQPYTQQCSQPENLRLGPDIRHASPHSPALYHPNEAFEKQHYEEQNYQDVNQEIGSLVLILMRGVPGSGKSTLARQISSRGPNGLILSTDDFFYQKDGYHFDPALLGDAHDWNHNRAQKAMLERRTPVVIDNTNIQAWEMKPYVSSALKMGYRVEFVEPDTSWKCDPVQLEGRNHHGVPRESIAKMLDRFERPVSVDTVMNSCEPSHKRKEHHSHITPYGHGR